MKLSARDRQDLCRCDDQRQCGAVDEQKQDKGCDARAPVAGLMKETRHPAILSCVTKPDRGRAGADNN